MSEDEKQQKQLGDLVTNFYRELTGDDTLSREWCLGHHLRSQWWRMSWRRRWQLTPGIRFWRMATVHKNGKSRETLRGFFNLRPGGSGR